MPDFSFTEMFGLFTAAFTQGAVILFVLIISCLMPTVVTRHYVNSKQPSDAVVSVKDVDVVLREEPHRSLIRGPFILIATMLAASGWGWFFFQFSDPAPQDSLCQAFYLILTGAAMVILLGHGHRQRATLSRSALSVWLGSFVGLVVLQNIVIADGPATKKSVASSVSDATAVSFPLSNETLKLASDHSSTLVIVLCLLIAVLSYLLLRPDAIGKRRRTKINLSKTFFKIPVLNSRFERTKIGAAAIFCISSFLPIFLAISYAENASADQEILIFLACILVFSVANWLVYIGENLKQVAIGVIFVLLILVYFVPMMTGRPLLLVNFTVRSMGLGDLRLSSITLSGENCATLKSYGATCSAGHDNSLGLSNVNLLSRIGSPIILELQVALPSDEKAQKALLVKQHDKPLYISRQQLEKAASMSCDSVLLSRLVRIDRAKADSLRCIRIVVPKAQVLSYVLDGRRRYTGPFSSLTFVSSSQSDKDVQGRGVAH
ncbi:hypothetical protein [Ralstonia sp. GX3-BWBA]|uniref:hypothetical protein n=1 Tax=Ralstonia sp. GX3-BWBA TaxID=2219865 RepID=UPI0013A6C764|nr:hypothetical protein [Ralstonia sp. GX3-BWBA]